MKRRLLPFHLCRLMLEASDGSRKHFDSLSCSKHLLIFSLLFLAHLKCQLFFLSFLWWLKALVLPLQAVWFACNKSVFFLWWSEGSTEPNRAWEGLLSSSRRFSQTVSSLSACCDCLWAPWTPLSGSHEHPTNLSQPPTVPISTKSQHSASPDLTSKTELPVWWIFFSH